ncbi:uncharacterized protein (DUF2132 family) [Bradyrhizobium diazoefficiens]|uniref:hypothetical protein n=1 Tax=Bradyrhizobium diazoefficiens TaxID=1355477 RepID=UPI003511EE28
MTISTSQQKATDASASSSATTATGTPWESANVEAIYEKRRQAVQRGQRASKRE